MTAFFQNYKSKKSKPVPMKEKLFTKSKIITIITFLLICSFSFTSIISYNTTKNSLQLNTKTEILPLISDNIYSEVQDSIIKPINNSSLMAHDEFLLDWILTGEEDLEDITRYLRRIRDEYGYFSAFLVSENTGNYYYYDGILKTINPDDEHDDWYYEFEEMNSKYDLDVDTNQAAADTMTIFINHRLEDHDGNFLGVTGIGLELASIRKTLEIYQDRFGPLIYMVDKEGTIQVHPNQNLVLQENINNLPGINELSARILSNETGTYIYEYKNPSGNYVISARYFPDFEWFLIIEQNQAEILKSARKSLILNIVIGLLVTGLVTFLVILTINLFHSKLDALASMDELTGLYNRRKFQEMFEHELTLVQRYGYPLSLLLIDVDHFKSVNDRFGHQIGDKILKTISQSLKREIREIDVIGRWGGEEFVILLHKTESEQAYQIAERLRNSIIRQNIIINKEKIFLTISIGISNAARENNITETMLQQADQAMYEAKQQGRNVTVVFRDASTPDPS